MTVRRNQRASADERAPGMGGKPIVIRISDELHAAIKARAAEEERPMAQVMRRALRQYVGEDLGERARE